MSRDADDLEVKKGRTLTRTISEITAEGDAATSADPLSLLTTNDQAWQSHLHFLRHEFARNLHLCSGAFGVLLSSGVLEQLPERHKRHFYLLGQGLAGLQVALDNMFEGAPQARSVQADPESELSRDAVEQRTQS